MIPIKNPVDCCGCTACASICAHDAIVMEPDVYGVRHKDMNEVTTSRSGAAFIAISDFIIEQGGIVYRAGYTDHFRVVHKRALNKEERYEFKGSKYVQSDLTSVFRQVKKNLEEGRTVLVC